MIPIQGIGLDQSTLDTCQTFPAPTYTLTSLSTTTLPAYLSLPDPSHPTLALDPLTTQPPTLTLTLTCTLQAPLTAHSLSRTLLLIFPPPIAALPSLATLLPHLHYPQSNTTAYTFTLPPLAGVRTLELNLRQVSGWVSYVRSRRELLITPKVPGEWYITVSVVTAEGHRTTGVIQISVDESTDTGTVGGQSAVSGGATGNATAKANNTLMIGADEGSSSIVIISFFMELFIEKETLLNMSSNNTNKTDFSKLAQEYLTKIKEKEIRKVRINLIPYAYLNPSGDKLRLTFSNAVLVKLIQERVLDIWIEALDDSDMRF